MNTKRDLSPTQMTESGKLYEMMVSVDEKTQAVIFSESLWLEKKISLSSIPAHSSSHLMITLETLGKDAWDLVP